MKHTTLKKKEKKTFEDSTSNRTRLKHSMDNKLGNMIEKKIHESTNRKIKLLNK